MKFLIKITFWFLLGILSGIIAGELKYQDKEELDDVVHQLFHHF